MGGRHRYMQEAFQCPWRRQTHAKSFRSRAEIGLERFASYVGALGKSPTVEYFNEVLQTKPGGRRSKVKVHADSQGWSGKGACAGRIVVSNDSELRAAFSAHHFKTRTLQKSKHAAPSTATPKDKKATATRLIHGRGTRRTDRVSPPPEKKI